MMIFIYLKTGKKLKFVWSVLLHFLHYMISKYIWTRLGVQNKLYKDFAVSFYRIYLKKSKCYIFFNVIKIKLFVIINSFNLKHLLSSQLLVKSFVFYYDSKIHIVYKNIILIFSLKKTGKNTLYKFCLLKVGF